MGLFKRKGKGRTGTVVDGVPGIAVVKDFERRVASCKGGQMTREAFDQAIDGAVGGGMLTAAEAAAARAML